MVPIDKAQANKKIVKNADKTWKTAALKHTC